MKYTRQQIKDVSLSAASHAEALATLYQMIREEIEQERKITRRKIRAAYSMTLDEFTLQHAGAKRPDPGRYLSGLALIESVFAAAGWTIVDDDREVGQEWRPAHEAPPLVEYLLTYDAHPGSLFRGVKQFVFGDALWCKNGRSIVPQPDRYWTGPVPPLPENDK